MWSRLAMLSKRFAAIACIVWAILWARSYTAPQLITYAHGNHAIKLVSAGGRLVVGYMKLAYSTTGSFQVRGFSDVPHLGSFDNIDVFLFEPTGNSLRRIRTARSKFGPVAYQSYGWASGPRRGPTDTRYGSSHFWLIFALLSLPLTIDAIRRLRAAMPVDPNLCPHCGYDLRATPTRCPECGSRITAPLKPAPNANPV
jgi:hypothetical protein